MTLSSGHALVAASFSVGACCLGFLPYLTPKAALGSSLGLMVSGGLVIAGVRKLATASIGRESELRGAHAGKPESDTLIAVAGRAVEAARELAGPLTVIELGADRLERPARRDAIVAEARRIREQVEHCRRILTGLRDRAERATAPR